MCRGLSLPPSFAAIVADLACLVVDGRLICVGILNVGRADVVHSRIIREVSPLPATAAIAIATIAIAIIDAAIITDVRSPVTRVKYIRASVPSPIRRGPQIPNLRRLDPRPRHPVISIIAISPISRCPNITIIWTGRLVVHLERWRRDVDG